MSRKANPNSKSTKESRCNCCGETFSEICDGTLRNSKYTCKDWRICPKCRRARMTLWRGIILTAAKICDGRMYLLTIEWSDSYLLANLLRRMRKRDQHYCAFRAEDKIYIFHTDTIEGGIKYLSEDLENFTTEQWDTITWTAVGRKISYRGIFKQAKTSYKIDHEGMEMVETISVKTNAPKSEELRLWNEARLKCGDPMPTTLAEEQAAIEQILPIFEQELVENEYKVEKILHIKRWKRINVTWKSVKNSYLWSIPTRKPQSIPIYA